MVVGILDVVDVTRSVVVEELVVEVGGSLVLVVVGLSVEVVDVDVGLADDVVLVVEVVVELEVGFVDVADVVSDVVAELVEVR